MSRLRHPTSLSPVSLVVGCLAVVQACGGDKREFGPTGDTTQNSSVASQTTAGSGSVSPVTSPSGPNTLESGKSDGSGDSSTSSGSNGSATETATTAELACPPAMRSCGGVCVATTDATACGPNCIVCTVPEGGTATCDGTECHVGCGPGLQTCGETCIPESAVCEATCPVNQHACDGQCTPLDNPNACGEDCTACPLPANAERATCENGACGFLCQLGAHACGTECFTDNDPNACGEDCVVCPTSENQTAGCVDGQCTATCNEGYHVCDATCVSDTDAAHCGGSCQPCPAPSGGSVTCESGQCVPQCPPNTELCLGECIAVGDACNGQCPSGQHDCSGVCRSDTSPASCGDSCTACPQPPGATGTSCDAGECDFTCGAGTTRCGDECLADTGPAECGAQCKQLPGPRLTVIPEGDLNVGADDLEFATVRVQSHFETFCIDQTEVTVADYEACVDAGGCEAPRALSGCNWGVAGQDNHPVTCIDWPRADAYCRWAGKRLPSEWEWEFAARGSSGRDYPWGDETPSSQYLNWRYEAAGGATTNVGSYPMGQTPDTHVFDLAGSVWEWTGSVWCDSKAPGATCQQGTYTARGGSFGSTYDIHVRSAWRDPDSAGDHRFGFRCAFGTVNP